VKAAPDRIAERERRPAGASTFTKDLANDPEAIIVT